MEKNFGDKNLNFYPLDLLYHLQFTFQKAELKVVTRISENDDLRDNISSLLPHPLSHMYLT